MATPCRFRFPAHNEDGPLPEDMVAPCVAHPNCHKVATAKSYWDDTDQKLNEKYRKMRTALLYGRRGEPRIHSSLHSELVANGFTVLDILDRGLADDD